MGKWLRSTVKLEENDQYQFLFGKQIVYAYIILNAYYMHIWASLVAQLIKNPPAMQETGVQSLDWKDALEKGKATHLSILAWRIHFHFHGYYNVHVNLYLYAHTHTHTHMVFEYSIYVTGTGSLFRTLAMWQSYVKRRMDEVCFEDSVIFSFWRFLALVLYGFPCKVEQHISKIWLIFLHHMKSYLYI